MPIESIMPSARLVFGLCSLALVAVIVAMIRKNAIKEKYAMLWLPLGIGLFLFGLFPEALLAISAAMHLHYMTVVVMCVIVVFTNILLYFTVKMSQLREDVKKLSQEIALSRAREAQAPSPAEPERPAAAGWLPASPAPAREARKPQA